MVPGGILYWRGGRRRRSNSGLGCRLIFRSVFFSLIFCSANADAESLLEGVVRDTNNNNISYVSIGFHGKGVGTVSDENGAFSLSVPDSLLNDTVTFSHLNYNMLNLTVNDVFANKVIVLNEKVYKLVTQNKKGQKYEVEIPEQIELEKNEEFFVSLETVRFFGTGIIHCPVHTGSGFTRDISMSALKKVPFNPGLSVVVSQINDK